MRLIIHVIAICICASATQAETGYPDAQELIARIDKLCAQLPGDPSCRGVQPVTCESDSGDVCTCGGGQTCEATATSCACFTAQPTPATVPPRRIGGLAVAPLGPQFAKIDVNCGGETYTISTGTDGGTCQATAPGSAGGGGGSCSDGGSGANVSCDTGCTSSSGSGSCSGPN